MTKKGTKRAGKAPAQKTVSELLKTAGVPLSVFMWLERYADGDKYALEPHAVEGPDTYEIARLVYDVLNSPNNETGTGLDERKFSEEARDFVEEWLYTLAGYYQQQVWNNPDAALSILSYILLSDGVPMRPEGGAAYVLLRAGVGRLTTKRERRAFLHSTDEADAEDEQEGETNWRAAFKLSRVLADPRTPEETRGKLIDLLHEFSTSARVDVTHPALARRAFQLMCDSKPRGNVRECRRDRKALLALLDSIEEGGD